MNAGKKILFKGRIKKAIELAVSFVLGLFIFSLIEGFDTIKHGYLTVLLCVLMLFLIGLLIPSNTKNI